MPPSARPSRPSLWHRLVDALRRRTEARALARRAIPDDLWKRTLVRYPFLQRRDLALAAELRRLTSLFLDRKEFSAAGGLTLRNDIVVAIAAQACLPVLRLGLDRYDGFVGIVVHPGAVVARRHATDETGVVHEYDETLAGEAMARGPVMLSWQDVRAAGQHGGSAYNVVIHEFAHVLDLADGASNGAPLLPPDLPAAEWAAVMTAEFARFTALVDAGASTVLDPYGAQGEDEFFAVASEAFFVGPGPLKDEHPALYALFARFYRQDPLAEGRFTLR
jgi:Mlc titration factor MtfA (ptsG expression regulator)